MKNFDQFQHQSLNESIVNKVLGAAKKVAQNTVGSSGTARARYGPNVKIRKDGQAKMSSANRQNRPGIFGVMKKNIDKFKKQNDGKDYDQAKRQTGRALRKAGSAFFARNQDKERVDTGQMGMGTALRKMGSQGQTTLRALAGAEPEQKGQKKDPRKTLAGKAAAGGFRKIQKKLFNVEPTARTGRGRPITGDANMSDAAKQKTVNKQMSDAKKRTDVRDKVLSQASEYDDYEGGKARIGKETSELNKEKQDNSNSVRQSGKVKVIKAKKPNNTTGSVNSSYEPEGESIQEINVIKNRQTLANRKGNTQIRNFFQKKKDDKREAALKKIEKEEFSCWREEFIWETDKKYPDKVKEIKPMTGKNTITINPEDETSKYKRGY
tara:strand:+ start:2243 stop:3382 length:1140 start_codon:yes stop_codon:yes gene_type:complete